MIKNPLAFAAKVDQLILRQERLMAIEAKLDALLAHHEIQFTGPAPGPGLVASETPPAPPEPAPAPDPETAPAPDEGEDPDEGEEHEHDPARGPRRRHRRHGT